MDRIKHLCSYKESKANRGKRLQFAQRFDSRATEERVSNRVKGEQRHSKSGS